jgi:2-polyprenyl-6-methoxyphenol hydroxylase-like FAD-dependent oxidoreductase
LLNKSIDRAPRISELRERCASGVRIVINSAAADYHFSDDHVFHVLVVGGGFSGTIAATLLGRAGYDVCMIDRHVEHPRDFRAEHLDGGTVDILERLGLLSDLTAGLFQGEQVHLARHGRIIGSAETANFGLRYEALVNRARALLPPSVKVVIGKAASITTSDSVQQIRLSGGRTISARLIVLATGAGFTLHKQLGMQRRIIRDHHSLTFGFNIVPTSTSSFPHSFLVYQRERIGDRIDYMASFTLSQQTRVNLFTYRDYRESWTRALMADPDSVLRQALPGFLKIMGPYRVAGPVEARPIDLYAFDNIVRDGVVVIGDAFQSACPATGMGMFRLLTDIERLTTVHAPAWLASFGMAAGKIAAFYHDPVKRTCDAKALHDSEYRRSLSTDMSPRWRMHRTRVKVTEQIQAWCHRLPTASQPRLGPERISPERLGSERISPEHLVPEPLLGTPFIAVGDD